MSDDATILRLQLADATATALTWRARYMAAHEVLLVLEDYIEAPLYPGLDVERLDKFSHLRASFLAYRAAVEQGAPLGWAVAEEGAEVGG